MQVECGGKPASLAFGIAQLGIPARAMDEPPRLVIGRIRCKHWFAVITSRAEAIRMISARRSRPEEIQLDEQFCVRAAF